MNKNKSRDNVKHCLVRNSQVDTEKYLTARDAAAMLLVSYDTLALWRWIQFPFRNKTSHPINSPVGAKTTAFGRKPCATALSTAIFPKPFPKAFFRKPRNIYPAHLSRCGAKPLSKNGWKPVVNKNAIGQSAPNALKKFGTGRNPFKRIRI